MYIFATNIIDFIMTQQTDIRWIQRYANFHKACRRLLDVTEADRFIEDLSELELEGLVQRFEYTFELAWKVMQDLLVYKGYEFMQGPNGTMKMAFEDGLISNHDGWRKMAKSRNTLSHVYDEAEVIPIVRLIYSDYAPLLKQLDNTLDDLSKNQDYQQQ
jgi:nucleotidyltransferase substrate binding protein (TIGR01987 family)